MAGDRCRRLGGVDSDSRIQVRVHGTTRRINHNKAYSHSKGWPQERGAAPRSTGSASEERDIPSASRRRPAGLLSDFLSGPKENRGLASNHKSQTSQPVHQATTVSHGNTCMYSQSRHSGFMGHIYRFKGRLPPCPYSQFSPQMAPLQYPRPIICFPVPAVRTLNSAESLYSSRYGGGRIPSENGCQGIHVSRRLDSPGTIQTAGAGTHAVGDSYGRKLGLHHQRQEVQSRTISDSIVLRGRHRPGTGSGDAIGGKSDQAHTGSTQAEELDGGYGENMDALLRLDGQYGRYRAVVPAQNASSSITSSRVLSCGPAGSGGHRTSPLMVTPSSDMVDNSGESSGRSGFSCAPPSSSHYNGCIIHRLGGSHGPNNGQRGLESAIGSLPHQRAGASGGQEHTAGAGQPGARSVGPDQIGQFNDSSLYKQGRGNSLSYPLLDRHQTSAVVSGQGDQVSGSPHPGGGQSGSRQSIKRSVSGSNRVGVSPSGSRSNLQSDGTPIDRSLCNQSKQAVTGVLLTDKRRPGVCNRRAVNRLDGSVGVCVSTDTTTIQSTAENSQGRMFHNPSSSILATTTLVCSPHQPPGGGPVHSPGPSGPSSNAGMQGTLPRHKGPAFDGVAAIRNKYIKAGFSEKAAQFVSAGRRRSTVQVYSSRLHCYYKWCDERGLDPATTTTPQVADFLCFIFDKNLQSSTVSGYLSAILSIHEGTPDGYSLRHDDSLKLLIEGFHNTRPPARKLWPEWDLDVVLDALNDVPFEPALAATLRDFTIKTSFLLALSSGRRASELHALAIGDHMVWHHRGGVSLYFRPSFLAKNERSGFSAAPISLPKLDSSAGARRMSCPVRALKWYLKKSESVRGNVGQLFITTTKPHKAAAKSTIAGWVVEAIMRSKAVKGGERPRAHSVRAQATTTAFHRGLAIRDVIETVSWKSSHVFVSTYLKDKPPESSGKKFARTVIGHKQ